jgi:hypothetical protein
LDVERRAEYPLSQKVCYKTLVKILALSEFLNGRLLLDDKISVKNYEAAHNIIFSILLLLPASKIPATPQNLVLPLCYSLNVRDEDGPTYIHNSL